MAKSPFAVPGPASHFLDNYLIYLSNTSMPEKQRRWCIVRVGEFINAQKDREIKTLRAADIADYFYAIGRQVRLRGRQFCP